MDWEAATLRAAEPALRARVWCPGPGPDAAEVAARQAVESGCRLLVSWGSAGALGDMSPGALLLAASVVDEAGVEHDCGAELLAHWSAALPEAPRGRLVSVAEPATSAAEKSMLKARTGADAVDMESAAVVGVAEGSGAGWICLRAIVDAAAVDVPRVALAGMDGPRARPGRVAARLLKSPRQLGAVLRLAGSARRARSALTAAATRIPNPPAPED
jgi:hypothetical protein